MLDILIPVHSPNLYLAKACIEAIDRNPPGVPVKFHLGLDGMARGDSGELQEWLRHREAPQEINPMGRLSSHQVQGEVPSRPPDWTIRDWPGPIYFAKSIASLIAACKAEFVLICPPWIRMTDPQWFGKMQQPFYADPRAMLSALPDPGTPQASLPPAQFLRRKGPTSECLLTRRIVAKDIAPRIGKVSSVVGWMCEFAKIAELLGGTRWLAQSVRHLSVKHEPHMPCPSREPSEIPEPSSKSPSPTTPSSSTVMTTEPDGSGDFVPF